jgi:hypothetical protein
MRTKCQRKNISTTSSSVISSEFLDQFKDLLSLNPESDLPEVDSDNDETFPELSAPIMDIEISEILNCLRADKSPGIDNLLK